MISVNEIMTADPISLGPSAPLSKAGELMKEHRIRHVPVAEDGKLLGLITQRDLLALASAEDQYSTTGELMRQNVFTVSVDSDMRGAALLMQKHKIGCLPVVREGQLVGIVTDSDYVSLAINLTPLPLPPASSYAFALTIDDQTQPDWRVRFFVRPPREQQQ